MKINIIQTFNIIYIYCINNCVITLIIMMKLMCAFKTTSKSFIKQNIFRAFASGESTVISRCTKNITDLLNPVRVKVTSTNDDPNGSHVYKSSLLGY